MRVCLKHYSLVTVFRVWEDFRNSAILSDRWHTRCKVVNAVNDTRFIHVLMPMKPNQRE